MSISVIVPTYHRPKYAGSRLEALRNQARAPDWVLVVGLGPSLAVRNQGTADYYDHAGE